MNFPDMRNLKPIPEQRMTIPVIPQLPTMDEWEEYQREQIATAQSEAAQEALSAHYNKPKP